MVLRRGITAAQKTRIVDELSGGENHFIIASRHGVSRWVVDRLAKSKANASGSTPGDHITPGSCRNRAAHHSDLEAFLIDWIAGKNADKCAVSSAMIKTKALRIKEFMLSQSDQPNPLLERFNASNGWFERFKKRAKIVKHSTAGVETSFDEAELARNREALKTNLEHFSCDDIFNVDETALYYKQLSTFSFGVQGTRRRDRPTDKNRVTVLFGCSKNGEKLKPLIVGKFVRPRCLRNTNLSFLPCEYAHNSNAWVTREIFKNYLTRLNEHFQALQRNVCIVLDNFAGHVTVGTFSNITLIYLPPGKTSVLQPLDSGIIHSFKAAYSRKVNEKHVSASDNHATFEHNIKDAIDMVANAWVSIEHRVIRSCWRKADICRQSLLDLADVASI